MTRMTVLANAVTDRLAVVLSTLGCITLLAGCGADRFDQEGCTSNDDCRNERICQDNRCINADELSSSDYEGTWQMELSGTITQEEDGEEDFEDELDVTVSEGEESDLVVELPADDDTCELGAELVEGGFEFVEEGCSVTQEGDEMTFSDVEGVGRREDDELFFEFEADVDVEPEDGDSYTAEYAVEARGTRIEEEDE